jgi:hypothetical protein
MAGKVRLSAILLLLAMAGCGGQPGAQNDGEATPPAPSSSPSITSPSPTPSKLVGEWERTTTCQERVQALTKAGLGRYAAEHAAGEGWIPGVSDPSELKDPKNPCQGAVPLKHSHFFTADGQFGSKDAQGDTVDDGSYELADEMTVIITKEFGEVTFHFVADDEKLVLTPVLPKCLKDGCFAAQWAVGMSYPGLEWSRTT